MIGEDYNEKVQRLKLKIDEFLKSEHKWIESRGKMIDSLLSSREDLDKDTRSELLNLKRDNEDSLAIISSLENMLRNRLTADSIRRISELIKGYSNYSDAITEDLERLM